jgi:TPR repeat protein
MSKIKRAREPSIMDARNALERGCDLYEKRKFKAARDAFELASKLGNRTATVNLANLYDSGELGARERDKAIRLYKLAATSGCPYGAYNLACLYRIENNRRWYTYWLNRAEQLSDRATSRSLFTPTERNLLARTRS